MPSKNHYPDAVSQFLSGLYLTRRFKALLRRRIGAFVGIFVRNAF